MAAQAAKHAGAPTELDAGPGWAPAYSLQPMVASSQASRSWLAFTSTAPFVSVLALPIAATLPSGGYSVSSGGVLLASSGLQQVICCRLCQLDPLLRAC